MENVLKTRVVSEQLGVNPTTIQRWIKYFNISCETNDHGHYLIAPQQLDLLQKIKQQLNEGLTMKQIRGNDETIEVNQAAINNKKGEKMLPANVIEERFEQLMIHIEQLERKLASKADEVVGYQVLQQRSEVDNLVSLLSTVEERISLLEQQLPQYEQQAVGNVEIAIPDKIRTSRGNKLKRIFSL